MFEKVRFILLRENNFAGGSEEFEIAAIEGSGGIFHKTLQKEGIVKESIRENEIYGIKNDFHVLICRMARKAQSLTKYGWTTAHLELTTMV